MTSLPPPNTPVGLEKGCFIRFGNPSADPWRLIDTSPPADLLVGENQGAKTLDLEDYILIPDQDSQHTLLFDHEQAGWLLYSSDEPREIGGPYSHGDEVVVNRLRWRVFLANAHSQTPMKPNGTVTPSQIHLVLRLSRDEENTQLTAIYGSSSHDLGDRAHHYLIAHLARVKSADLDEGLDLSSSGWIDKERLAKDLGVSSNHLNLQIHRAQKHLCDELRITPKEANRLFDRQRGRVRLGFISCDVFKGDTLLTKLAS